MRQYTRLFLSASKTTLATRGHGKGVRPYRKIHPSKMRVFGGGISVEIYDSPRSIPFPPSLPPSENFYFICMSQGQHLFEYKIRRMAAVEAD